jgi:hypothetical protein
MFSWFRLFFFYYYYYLKWILEVPQWTSLFWPLMVPFNSCKLNQVASLQNSNFMSNSDSLSRVSVVGIVTSYGLHDRGVGVRVPVGSRISSSPRHLDQLWGPPNLLSSGYQGALSSGVKRPGRELTTHIQLLLRSRKCGSIHPLSHMPSWRSA